MLRSGTYNKRGWIAWHELPFAAGDPAYVAECLERAGSPADSWPDARAAFVGGEATLQLMISWWKRYQVADAQRLIVEGLGQIRSEAIVSLMLDMSAKSRVKTAVRAWFQTRRDYAGPILEDAAQSRGVRASLAKKVLERLGV